MPENQKGKGKQGGDRGNRGGNPERELASADRQTKEKVSGEGGRASKGSGRQSGNGEGKGR